MVAIEPGGVFAPIHDHKDRPGAVYILQGTVTNHRDGIATDYGPGVGWPEGQAKVRTKVASLARPLVLLLGGVGECDS